jgi:GH24 family phage-related lysozyme (muramidase)
MSLDREHREKLECTAADSLHELLLGAIWQSELPKTFAKVVEPDTWFLPQIDLSNSRDYWQMEINPSFQGITSFSSAEIGQLRSKIIVNEGERSTVYKDSKGISTVGIGFNLEQPGAKEAIEYIGADFDNVRSGQIALTKEQIKILGDISLANAIMQADKLYPNLASLPYQKRAVVVDLAYNIGGEKLDNQFVRFSAALRNGNIEEAAKELTGTKYEKQVGERAKQNIRDLSG